MALAAGGCFLFVLAFVGLGQVFLVFTFEYSLSILSCGLLLFTLFLVKYLLREQGFIFFVS